MRNAQITIKLEMTNDQAWNGHHETISVYADASTPHEALCAATYELLAALQEQGHDLPGFGVREHSCKPDAAGLTEEQKAEIRKQNEEMMEHRRQQLWENFDKRRKGES